MKKHKSPARAKKTSRLVKGLGKYGLVLLVVTILGAGLVGISNLFRVKTIACTLDAHPCPTTLQSSLNGLQHQFLFFTDFESLIQKMGVPIPVILTHVQKELPSTLEVSFSSETLAYLLQTDQGQVSISQSGILFRETADKPARTIEIKPPLTELLDDKGHLQPPIHQGLLAVTTSLEKNPLPVTHITWVDKDTIVLIMNEGTLTATIDNASPTTELEKLQTILQSDEYKKVAANVKEIDVRFKLPVLRMKQ